MIIEALTAKIAVNEIKDFIVLASLGRLIKQDPDHEIISIQELNNPLDPLRLKSTKEIFFFDGHGDYGYLEGGGGFKMKAQKLKILIKTGFVNCIKNIDEIRIIVCSSADKGFVGSKHVSLMAEVRDGLNELNAPNIPVKAYKGYAVIMHPDPTKKVVCIRKGKGKKSMKDPFDIQQGVLDDIKKRYGKGTKELQDLVNDELTKLETDSSYKTKSLSEQLKIRALLVSNMKAVDEFFTLDVKAFTEDKMILDKPKRMVISGPFPEKNSTQSILDKTNANITYASLENEASGNQYGITATKFTDLQKAWKDGYIGWDDPSFLDMIDDNHDDAQNIFLRTYLESIQLLDAKNKKSIFIKKLDKIHSFMVDNVFNLISGRHKNAEKSLVEADSGSTRYFELIQEHHSALEKIFDMSLDNIPLLSELDSMEQGKLDACLLRMESDLSMMKCHSHLADGELVRMNSIYEKNAKVEEAGELESDEEVVVEDSPKTNIDYKYVQCKQLANKSKARAETLAKQAEQLEQHKSTFGK